MSIVIIMMPWAIPASTPPPPPPSTRSSEQRRRRRKQKSQGGRFDAVFPASLPTLLQPPPFVQFWEEGKKVRKWTGRLNKGNLSCQLAKVSNFTVSLWRDIGFSASNPQLDIPLKLAALPLSPTSLFPCCRALWAVYHLCSGFLSGISLLPDLFIPCIPALRTLTIWVITYDMTHIGRSYKG